MEKQLSKIQKGSSVLRPRARLIKTIGEELISSDVVAVMELVKNSYDADASIITITFSGQVEEIPIKKNKSVYFLSKDNSALSISDDGEGMSLDTINNAWMEPATVSKKKQTSSTGQRRYTGEKGIGRFASAKLSNRLKIITREEGNNEVVVDFNWQDFANDDLYLDQVEAAWEVRVPIEISTHGTKLVLTELNTPWDEEKIRNLQVALSRIINPVAPVTGFLIDLEFPENLDEFSGLIEPPASINYPNYLIKGEVNSNGQATIHYTSRKNPEIQAFEKKFLKEKKTEAEKQMDEIPFKTGPFNFEFRVWDREPSALNQLATDIESTVKNVKADLDHLAGVSIYRDAFRVLPYGEPKNDWLRLNARRVNNPTMRLSVNQIVGYVSITRDGNPVLVDQSNREGIVESQAFDDLQEQVRLILNELEQKRYEERPRREDEQTVPQSLYAAFTVAPIAEAVSKKLPGDKEVLDLIQKTQLDIDAGVTKVQEVLARYRRLSTLGQIIDSILHDGNHFLLNIDSEIRLLTDEIRANNQDLSAVLKHLETIEQQRKILAQLFKRIEPFGGRKRGRPATIIIEDSIRNVFELKRSELDREKISFELPTSENKVTIDDGELQMMILNLLQNSIHWLGQVSDRKIIVEVERRDDELSLIFSDSGPGIKEEQSKFVFDPYYTTREDGIGLGLTIVGELAADYNGDFFLLNEGPLEGATFKLVFRRRI